MVIDTKAGLVEVILNHAVEHPHPPTTEAQAETGTRPISTGKKKCIDRHHGPPKKLWTSQNSREASHIVAPRSGQAGTSNLDATRGPWKMNTSSSNVERPNNGTLSAKVTQLRSYPGTARIAL